MDAKERVTISVQPVEPGPDVAAFVSRVWNQYHLDRGHDLSFRWMSEPVRITARDQSARIIGVAGGRISAGVGHLSELLVGAAYRQQGVGGRLLAMFEKHCESAKCHKLSLHTEVDGPARSFYERRGWKQESTFIRDKAGLDFVRLIKFLAVE